MEKNGATKNGSGEKRRRQRLLEVALVTVVCFSAGLYVTGRVMLYMPGSSHEGNLPAMVGEEKQLSSELESIVVHLATTIGPRAINGHYESLLLAADYINGEFQGMGFDVERQSFSAPASGASRNSKENSAVDNLIAEIRGGSLADEIADEIIVLGAHYDTCYDTPGANDNGSGIAALLSLARLLVDTRPDRTIRFVAFVNEEPPYFQTEHMGSLVYARRCREREENIVSMLCLETMGYYSTEPGSQKLLGPLKLFYPSTGNFIAFVGNLSSKKLVERFVGSFREHVEFPSEGASLPDELPGVGWSDHWSFWQEGYPGVMVTDTAPFRYPHYHEISDTPDKLDYESLARVVSGLKKVINEFASEGAP